MPRNKNNERKDVAGRVAGALGGAAAVGSAAYLLSRKRGGISKPGISSGLPRPVMPLSTPKVSIPKPSVPAKPFFASPTAMPLQPIKTAPKRALPGVNKIPAGASGGRRAKVRSGSVERVPASKILGIKKANKRIDTIRKAKQYRAAEGAKNQAFLGTLKKKNGLVDTKGLSKGDKSKVVGLRQEFIRKTNRTNRNLKVNNKLQRQFPQEPEVRKSISSVKNVVGRSNKDFAKRARADNLYFSRYK